MNPNKLADGITSQPDSLELSEREKRLLKALFEWVNREPDKIKEWN